MTRADVIRTMAEQNGTTRARAAEDFRRFCALMRETLLSHGEFPLWGLGKLKLVRRAARMARNPKTGASLRVPSRRGVKFLPSGEVKRALR